MEVERGPNSEKKSVRPLAVDEVHPDFLFRCSQADPNDVRMRGGCLFNRIEEPRHIAKRGGVDSSDRNPGIGGLEGAYEGIE
jgi:hypothetical protein